MIVQNNFFLFFEKDVCFEEEAEACEVKPQIKFEQEDIKCEPTDVKAETKAVTVLATTNEKQEI